MARRVVVAVLLLMSLAAAQAKRPFAFEDMMKLQRLGDPAVPPDGRWVLFSAVDVNLAENSRRSHIWIVPLAGGDATQITRGNGEDRARWSPSGKQVLYGSESQLYLADFDSATGQLAPNPRKLTSISTGASGAMWAPDGKHIVFVSEVWPECNAAGDAAAQDACNKQRDDARAASKVKARVFTELLFRHWNAFTNEKRSHLFVVPAEGGQARDFTPGDREVPTFSLGGQDLYAISPDGQEVCFTTNRDAVPAISTNNDLFTVPITGGTPKQLTTNPGSDSTPLYSPDGKYIAYRAQFRAGYEADRFRLLLYERATGKITNLTENFDRWVGTMAWAPDSKTIYFSAEDKGESPLYVLAVSGGEPRELIRGHNDDVDVTVTGDGRTLVFTRVSVQAPSEIFSATPDPRSACAIPAGSTPPILPLDRPCRWNVRQLTHRNDAVLSQVAMQPLEPFWFTGSENVKVQGFLVKPPNFDAAKKYPVKFLIHGGPQGAWSDSWSYRWNPELFAASGYVVVMINPRGSTGYGQKFIDDINGDWGGRVYQDLMLGLDYAEKTYPFIDKDRECALGASYGGYMANWIEGHTTRFKCIVSHDGMFNSESAWGSTEELWFNEWEFKGMPWTEPRPLPEVVAAHVRAELQNPHAGGALAARLPP